MERSGTTLSGILRLRLTGEQRERLARWAASAYPTEACGPLIGGAHGGESRVLELRRGRNLERDRATERYLLDPHALFDADRAARDAGLDVIGFWHSHPDAPAVPSETDRERAWPGYAYLIVPVVAGDPGGPRVWWLVDEAFEEGELLT